jgi:hypothetical protein
MPTPEIPRPKVSGGKRPEPFNESDESRFTSDILHGMCRLEKRCFFPSEFVMEEEMEGAGAYHNPEAKEKALYGKPNEYYNIVSYCLERLLERKLVVKEKRIEESDNTQYVVYCKTKLLKELCPEIMKYQLSDINRILKG